jgi:hypothetical protein
MELPVFVCQLKPNKPHIQLKRGYYRVSGSLGCIYHEIYTSGLVDRWQAAYDFAHRVNENIGFGGKKK